MKSIDFEVVVPQSRELDSIYEICSFQLQAYCAEIYGFESIYQRGIYKGIRVMSHMPQLNSRSHSHKRRAVVQSLFWWGSWTECHFVLSFYVSNYNISMRRHTTNTSPNSSSFYNLRLDLNFYILLIWIDFNFI